MCDRKCKYIFYVSSDELALNGWIYNVDEWGDFSSMTTFRLCGSSVLQDITQACAMSLELRVMTPP